MSRSAVCCGPSPAGATVVHRERYKQRMQCSAVQYPHLLFVFVLQGATQDLFELLERVQSSRLDDQRCVLPPYFTQVSRACWLAGRVCRTQEERWFVSTSIRRQNDIDSSSFRDHGSHWAARAALPPPLPGQGPIKVSRKFDKPAVL